MQQVWRVSHSSITLRARSSQDRFHSLPQHHRSDDGDDASSPVIAVRCCCCSFFSCFSSLLPFFGHNGWDHHLRFVVCFFLFYSTVLFCSVLPLLFLSINLNRLWCLLVTTTSETVKPVINICLFSAARGECAANRLNAELSVPAKNRLAFVCRVCGSELLHTATSLTLLQEILRAEDDNHDDEMATD